MKIRILFVVLNSFIVQLNYTQQRRRNGNNTAKSRKERLTGPWTFTMTAKFRAKSTTSGKPMLNKQMSLEFTDCFSERFLEGIHKLFFPWLRRLQFKDKAGQAFTL
uniref:Secreted protein n=1 Tax=Rhizophora mucronata TaxID=61149 RepID=A0A2P2KD32_RHIMU